jgi:hypothetical protein
MLSRARLHKAKALECEHRAAMANDPGVKTAYRRAAAQWFVMARDAAATRKRKRPRHARSAMKVRPT